MCASVNHCVLVCTYVCVLFLRNSFWHRFTFIQNFLDSVISNLKNEINLRVSSEVHFENCGD